MTSLPWSEACKKKWIEPDNVASFVAALKSKGKTIATLNGSFDLMHAGHLHIIYEAKQQASLLIIALNTDASIKRYKSASRPIITLNYRLQMVSALEFVDYVTWFDETDPCAILSKIRPDVHVNGAEYGKECVEAATVKECGGRLHLVERIDGLATSDVISKVRGL